MIFRQRKMKRLLNREFDKTLLQLKFLFDDLQKLHTEMKGHYDGRSPDDVARMARIEAGLNYRVQLIDRMNALSYDVLMLGKELDAPEAPRAE